MLRSSNRYKALDVTGVFGSACRHEFPKLFFDMKHGEQLVSKVFLEHFSVFLYNVCSLAYSVKLIEEILEKNQPE